MSALIELAERCDAARGPGKTVAYFRLVNCAFVWIGPIEIGWRMPWLEHSAHALYPHYFEDQQHG